MARQVQIRRGTSAQNNSFIGAIGEITMDTTNNTLRVHNGTIAGGTILAKKSEIPDISNLAKKTEIPDISGLAKKSEIPDISNLAKKSDIPNISGIIDYVTAWQKPTSANGYAWYRKYKSGWVEQGGAWTGSIECKNGYECNPSVNLIVKMADGYNVQISIGGTYLIPMGYDRTQTGIKFRIGAYATTRTLTRFTWCAFGMAA